MPAIILHLLRTVASPTGDVYAFGLELGLTGNLRGEPVDFEGDATVSDVADHKGCVTSGFQHTLNLPKHQVQILEVSMEHPRNPHFRRTVVDSIRDLCDGLLHLGGLSVRVRLCPHWPCLRVGAKALIAQFAQRVPVQKRELKLHTKDSRVVVPIRCKPRSYAR